jgi:hypothetical protein
MGEKYANFPNFIFVLSGRWVGRGEYLGFPFDSSWDSVD